MPVATADPFAMIDAEPVTPEPAQAPTPEPAAQQAQKTPAATTRKPRCRQPLYVDIETIPDESRAELFGLEPLPTVGPRTPAADMMPADQFRTGSLDEIKQVVRSKRPDDEYLSALEAAEKADKKPRKGLFDLIDELRNEGAGIEAAADAQRKTMSCTPEMCRLVALGWAVGDEVAESLVVGQQTSDGRRTITEADLLDEFWSRLNMHRPVIGYNVLGFDLPVLFVRSILIGIQPSVRLDMKPWGTDVIDLMAARFPKSQAKKLKDLARMMGIPVPAGDVDGSQVAELFATNPAKLGEYVRSDVQISRELHMRYRGFFCA